MTDDKKQKFVTADGYAPEVPKHESPTLADDYTLILMVRDHLQNGRNGTRANLAFAELVKRMGVELPKLSLDPVAFVRDDTGERTDSAKGVDPERVEEQDDGSDKTIPPTPWTASFKPRYNHSQDFSEYNPGPGAIGWYDDPDGSGRERWWLGIMWSDTYRDKVRGRA